MTKDEALKMAILQFERINKEYDCTEIIDICKDALAHPAQEPVAWLSADSKANEIIKTHPCALARTAPSWQGLSEKERSKFVGLHCNHDLVRAIEQALKEKNT